MAQIALASNNPFKKLIEEHTIVQVPPAPPPIPPGNPSRSPPRNPSRLPPTAPSDLCLILEGTSVFDPSLPEIALYQISHLLNVNSTTKIRSLMLDDQASQPKYKCLYTFSCVRKGNRHVIEILQPSSLGRIKTSYSIELRSSASIEDHRVWEVILRQPDRATKILQGFKFAAPSAPVMWRDGKGDLLALDIREDPDDRQSCPMLKVLQDRDETTMDLLVVAWCARLWGMEHEMKWERELEREKERAMGDEKGPRRSILGIKW